MIGKQIAKGRPDNYALALQKANLTIPVTVTDNQHSMLKPISRWFSYSDSRYADPPRIAGEADQAYRLRICRHMAEGDTYSNYPDNRLNYWW